VPKRQALSPAPLLLEGAWRAYAVAGPLSLLTRTVLLCVDLLAGGTVVLSEAPGRGMGLAVTGDRLYVADPEGSGVWGSTWPAACYALSRWAVGQSLTAHQPPAAH